MVQYLTPFILLICYSISADGYAFFKLPSKFFHKREISSWKCAQKCFNRFDETDELGLRHRRQVGEFDGETPENMVALNLLAYCQKSADELACLRTCTESNVTRQLLDLGTKVKNQACSNLKAAVKTYNCVLKSDILPECVYQNCKSEINSLNQAIEERAQQGERIIPGKQFCNLEDCSRRCMKKVLPLTCGQKSFSLYTNVNDMANAVQALTMFESKPETENGILCVDRPLPEIDEEDQDEYEEERRR